MSYARLSASSAAHSGCSVQYRYCISAAHRWSRQSLLQGLRPLVLFPTLLIRRTVAIARGLGRACGTSCQVAPTRTLPTPPCVAPAAPCGAQNASFEANGAPGGCFSALFAIFVTLQSPCERNVSQSQYQCTGYAPGVLSWPPNAREQIPSWGSLATAVDHHSKPRHSNWTI